MGIYQGGHAKLTAGSAIVEGIGTHWLNYVREGDVFNCDGISEVILSVDDNHFLTLQNPSTITSEENRIYEIVTGERVGNPRALMRCTASQFRRALTAKGLRTAVENAISAADQDTNDMYHYEPVFHRMHPKIVAIASAIGATETELDEVFELGMTL